MATATVNGVTLHHDVEGSGPPLLLIAGLGTSSLAGGHGMLLEYPDDTLAAITTFLAGAA